VTVGASARAEEATDGGRRHPRWGIAAQVTAIVGAVLLVLVTGLTWAVYVSTSQRANDLVAQLDATTAEAQEKYDAVAASLEGLAGLAPNPDTQSLLQDGADLVRDVGAQVASIDQQVGDLVGSVFWALLLIVGFLTALLAYLVLIHGGIWTLGRHWRRD
jgi:hypothetical protein